MLVGRLAGPPGNSASSALPALPASQAEEELCLDRAACFLELGLEGWDFGLGLRGWEFEHPKGALRSRWALGAHGIRVARIP